jgi:hypothetical protein
MPRPKATEIRIDDLGYKRIGIKHIHRLVAERALGRPLKAREVVHHVDGDKTNNAGSNLVICPDRHYHWLLHKRANAMEATGNPDAQKCEHCQQWDLPMNMSHRIRRTRTGKDGRTTIWWHARCLSEYNFKRGHRKSPVLPGPA